MESEMIIVGLFLNSIFARYALSTKTINKRTLTLVSLYER